MCACTHCWTTKIQHEKWVLNKSEASLRKQPDEIYTNNEARRRHWNSEKKAKRIKDSRAKTTTTTNKMQKYAIIFVFSLFVVYVGVYSLKGKRERGRERNRITNFIVLGSIANIANTFSFIFFQHDWIVLFSLFQSICCGLFVSLLFVCKKKFYANKMFTHKKCFGKHACSTYVE